MDFGFAAFVPNPCIVEWENMPEKERIRYGRTAA